MLQLRFHLLIPSTGLAHIRLRWSYPASPLGFVIMVTIHTGCKQQVREINNAIAVLFVARDSVIGYLVRLEGNPARARIYARIRRLTAKVLADVDSTTGKPV